MSEQDVLLSEADLRLLAQAVEANRDALLKAAQEIVDTAPADDSKSDSDGRKMIRIDHTTYRVTGVRIDSHGRYVV